MDAQKQNSRKLKKKIVKQQKEKEKEEMNKEVQKQLEKKRIKQQYIHPINNSLNFNGVNTQIKRQRVAE